MDGLRRILYSLLRPLGVGSEMRRVVPIRYGRLSRVVAHRLQVIRLHSVSSRLRSRYTVSLFLHFKVVVWKRRCCASKRGSSRNRRRRRSRQQLSASSLQRYLRIIHNVELVATLQITPRSANHSKPRGAQQKAFRH